MSNAYLWRFIVALIFFGIGYYLAGSREDVNAVLKSLDKLGIQSGDTDVKRKKSGDWFVRAFYIAGAAFILSMGLFFYHNHRKAAATPYPGTEAMPYQKPAVTQPAGASTQPSASKYPTTTKNP